MRGVSNPGVPQSRPVNGEEKRTQHDALYRLTDPGVKNPSWRKPRLVSWATSSAASHLKLCLLPGVEWARSNASLVDESIIPNSTASLVASGMDEYSLFHRPPPPVALMRNRLPSGTISTFIFFMRPAYSRRSDLKPKGTRRKPTLDPLAGLTEMGVDSVNRK